MAAGDSSRSVSTFDSHSEADYELSSDEEMELGISSSSLVSATSDGKRKKYVCVYKREYSKRFPWSAESKKGKTFAYCMPCSRDVCLGQGGTKDLNKHERTYLHINLNKASLELGPYVLTLVQGICDYGRN